MLDGNNRPLSINGLNQALQEKVKQFLHGAIHDWCKIHSSGDKFSFNTFMNDADDDCWKHTPLIELYNLYKTSTPPQAGTVDPAMKEAAKKGGLLLKAVLQEEGRNFKTVPNSSPNEYELV